MKHYQFKRRDRESASEPLDSPAQRRGLLEVHPEPCSPTPSSKAGVRTAERVKLPTYRAESFIRYFELVREPSPIHS
jgi:hypothetical protein